MYFFYGNVNFAICRREWNRNVYVNGNSQTYHYYLRIHLWVIIIFWGINFLSDNESIVCCYKHSFPQRRFILMMFRDACRFRIHSPLAFTFITDRIFRNLWTLYLPFVDHSSTKLASYDCHSWILRHYSLTFIFRIQSS